ncbi:MAG: hypothetical protein OXC46_11590, partial [Thaumarchaeota archaeon]|nr:hypothetical protein [Nitrososphaerota archaeon]
MNENKLKQIKNQIEDQKWDYWISNNLINFLTEQNIKLNMQELYELTKYLINENAFGFLFPISNIIRDLASADEDFIKILESIIGEIKNDMAQGPFIDSLTFIGKSNPALAMKIADKLLKSSEPEYSSFLIGSSFHKLSNKGNAFITKLLSSENPRYQVTALKTLRIVYKDREIKDMQKTFNTLENASKSDFIEVKSEALEAFLDFYKNDIQKSNRIIENLVRNHTKCKYLLAKRITFQSPFDDKTSLYFLDICSEDSDINVKRTVFNALVKFTKKHADVVLEILAKYTIRDKYDLDGMGYVLKNMGETNATNALVIILDWFKNDRYLKLRRYISVMIKDLVSKTDKKIILKPIFQ